MIVGDYAETNIDEQPATGTQPGTRVGQHVPCYTEQLGHHRCCDEAGNQEPLWQACITNWPILLVVQLFILIGCKQDTPINLLIG